ncbi:MAG: hypothetical protein E7240_00500 [Lachnospiraceae bacterium]|nr:hypothetical protein [Lachnospiraceae bacterium]
MMEYAEYYEKAIRSIAEGTDPNSFAKLFYKCFQIPIIIVDEAFKLLAFANGGSFEDPYWEDIAQYGAARTETITDQYIKAGYLESIANSSTAIYVDWGVSRDYPQSCGPVYVNKELEGFISLLFMDIEKKEEACRLNTMVCSLFGIFLQTSDYQKKNMRNPVRQVFARRFFNPEEFSEPLDPVKYRPYVDISPEYQIAVIGIYEENDSMQDFLRGRIRSIYPNIIYQFRENRLYILMENRNEASMGYIRQRMRAVLTDYQFHAGLSGRFTEISERAKYIEQAETALQAGMASDPDEIVYYFRDYYPAIIFRQAKTSLSEENLIPDELKILAQHDREFGTDYKETLFGYLYERNDLNRAANYLHIHRNTLRYRMEKIRQIIGMDPDDPETALRLTSGYGVSGCQR